MKSHQRNSSIILVTSFFAEARLVSTIGAVEMEISKLPSIEVLSKGTILRCIADRKGINAELIFRRDSITYKFNFNKPSQAEYAKHLLAFISILSFLRDHYEVKIGALYRYVVQALQSSIYGIDDFASAAELERAHLVMNALNESNSKLAESILELETRIGLQEQKINLLESFARAILNNSGSAGVMTLLNSAGITDEEINKIEKLLGMK
ncbi:MAG: hypothetical protein ACP5RM_00475 [Candidatus Micrarchaeia archaeon]